MMRKTMVTVVGQNMFWNGVLQLGVATWRVVPEIDCVGLLILSSPFQLWWVFTFK
jgi:hypothetical protein